MKKYLALLVLFLWSVLTLTPGVFAQESDPSHETSSQVRLEVGTQPFTEDGSWPIVDFKQTQYTDEAGVVHLQTRIVREVEFSNPEQVACDGGPKAENLFGLLSTEVTCTKVGASTVQDSHQLIVNGTTIITMYGKSITDKYKDNSQITYYKPTSSQLWWTRLNSTYTVQNAVGDWGCQQCLYCQGGNGGVVYHINTFTPGWSNSTNSYVYTWSTTTLFPAMKAAILEIPLGLIATSNGYQNGTFKGDMDVVAKH